MMKRIIVMNGSRVVQSREEKTQDWKIEKITTRTSIKPGIYNISAAQKADIKGTYLGTILHREDGLVYQKYGKKIIAHDSSAFDNLPGIGTLYEISYNENGRASVAMHQRQTMKTGRGR